MKTIDDVFKEIDKQIRQTKGYAVHWDSRTQSVILRKATKKGKK